MPLPPEELLDLAHVRAAHRRLLAKAALALSRLLLEQVALHRPPAQHLARSGQLEPLLRRAVCLLLWHRLWILLRSSSGPAPSPCSGRPAGAGTLPARSPSRPRPAASAGRARAPDAWSPGRGT